MAFVVEPAAVPLDPVRHRDVLTADAPGLRGTAGYAPWWSYLVALGGVALGAWVFGYVISENARRGSWE